VAFSILGILLSLGTLVDVLRRVLQVYDDDSPPSPQPPSFGLRLCLAFSLYSNFVAIMSTKKSAGTDNLDVINGIRFISMTWVVLGHNFLMVSSYLTVSNVWEVLFIQTGGLGFAFRAVMNALPSVDTFFMLSGLLVSYMTFKELDRCRGRFSFVTYYLHRYIVVPSFCVFSQ
jgi:peptidoglycan/LPS O-acetylase OafA/YrhL